MNKFLALSLVAAIPAFAGEINLAMAEPHHSAQASPLASESTAQKVTPPVKGGLLNVPVTKQQAAKATHDTNRRIARGEIKPQPRPSADD